MKENSALLVIDLQAFIKWLNKDAVPYGWQRIIENNRRLISAFDARKLPVYLVTVEPKFLWPSARKAFSRMILQTEQERYSHLHQFAKYGPSAFTQSDYGLEAALKKQDITRIYVTGVSLDNGVLKTARDGAKAGFETVVIKDATASRTLSRFERALSEITDFAKIVETEEECQ